jgi:signal transduction histidine kinase
MITAPSRQPLELTPAASLRAQEQAEQDQLRWFSAESPAFFAALLAFALGSSCWQDHAGAVAIFAGTLASAAYWRSMLAGSMQSQVRSDALRRSTYFTAALWAALGCWAAFAHLSLAAQFIYLLLTAAFAASATRGLASDIVFARRYLLILLLPAFVTQFAAGRMAGSVEGYSLAAATLLFSVFLTARAGQLNAAYWDTLTSTVRLATQSQEWEQTRRATETSQRTESGLLAKISEDAQAPLRGVARMTGLLLETAVSNEQREYLEAIRDSTSLLRHLMNNLFEFSSMEAGESKLAAKAFDPRRVLEGVAEMFQAKAAAKRLRFSVHSGAGLTRALVGDAQRIGQILANLAANAIQFTEQGSVEIFADCRAGAEKAVLCFEVRDTGIGIPAEKMATLFRPAARRPGLGLAIAGALAKQMGGRIGAESEAGQGSHFWVSVPLPYAPGVAVHELVPEEEMASARG